MAYNWIIMRRRDFIGTALGAGLGCRLAMSQTGLPGPDCPLFRSYPRRMIHACGLSTGKL